MMRKKFLFIYFFLILLSNLYAQKLPFTTYTTKEGLINNRSGCMGQDGLGYIWIGTDEGICRYDGVTFKYFPKPGKLSSYFTSFSKDYKGSVVFAITGGIAISKGNTVKFYLPHEYENIPAEDAEPINDSVYWVSYRGMGIVSLTILSGDSIKVSKPIINNTSLFYLAADKQNNIWIGSKSQLLFCPGGDIKKSFYLKFFDGHYINDIDFDKQNYAYIVSDKDVYRYTQAQIKNIVAESPSVYFHFPKGINTAISFDSTGNTWISSISNGLHVKWKDKKDFELLNTSNGIVSFVWDCYVDRENNKWFVTENGVFKLASNNVWQFEFDNTAYSYIKSGIVLNDSTFLFNNAYNMYLIQNNKLYKQKGYSNIPGFLEERLLKTSDNKIWVTSNGPTNQEAHKLSQLKIASSGVNEVIDNSNGKFGNVSNLDMRTSTFDAQGTVWVLNNLELYYYEQEQFKNISVRDFDGKPAEIRGIAGLKNGNLYCITLSGNIILVSVIRNSSGKIVQLVPQKYTKEPCINLGGYAVYKTFLDSHNNLWLMNQSPGQLIRLKLNNNNEIIASEEITQPFLSGKGVYDIVEDDENQLWVATTFGLDKISFKKDETLLIQKNLYANEICGRLIFFIRKQQQKLYIGSTGCLVVLDLTQQSISKKAPLVYITDASIYNKPDSAFLNNNNVKLAAESNNISFTFTGLSFTNEKRIQYKYRLLGVDKDWSPVTSSRSVTYSHLSAGTYTFKVLAQNQNGIWSKEAALKTFTIATPYYNTWWFYGLCITLMAGLLYAIYLYRVKQILAVERVRQRISADLHDEIGSTLSSITQMSSIAKRKALSNPEEASALAAKVEVNSRAMIHNMNDIIWSIRPGNDTLEQLVNRLREYMNDILEEKDIEYSINLTGNILNKKISMELRRDIYLICKEIIHNTAKYADASNFLISVSIFRNNLLIITSDNGKGFNLQTIKKGNGLMNIQNRVTTHKGTAKLLTDAGGTKWEIEIPLT